ncbi:MAG: response regulator [Gallionellaceae bacterium]|nr:response regulator [Gallionellaceae bacterium]
MSQQVNETSVVPVTLLFIDDEANILAALKRLFRPHGYTILTAESGAEALAILEKETVDLVISDMRMPQMTGAEVLEKIRNKWPEVVRILLTGFSDISSTIAAINRGEIYRYISKPWNDDDIVLIVRDALERKHLLAEKQRLEELTIRQNLALTVMNASLEEKVLQRTEELHTALERLKKDYFSTLQVFSNLMELRKGAMAGHSRRVAQLCRNIGHKMRLPESDIQNIETAALLHNLGKIGLPDHLLDKPYMELSYAERVEFDKHPLRAAAALMALDPLLKAAELIRHYHEHYNGEGNVSHLHGEGIPLGARILRVASDYDELQQGLISHDKLSPEQALKSITSAKNTRYDPIIVDIFSELMSHVSNYGATVTEFLVNSAQLHAGMLLTRDVLTHNGMLLLLKNTALNVGQIHAIQQYEQSSGEQLTIYTHSI